MNILTCKLDSATDFMLKGIAHSLASLGVKFKQLSRRVDELEQAMRDVDARIKSADIVDAIRQAEKHGKRVM